MRRHLRFVLALRAATWGTGALLVVAGIAALAARLAGVPLPAWALGAAALAVGVLWGCVVAFAARLPLARVAAYADRACDLGDRASAACEAEGPVADLLAVQAVAALDRVPSWRLVPVRIPRRGAPVLLGIAALALATLVPARTPVHAAGRSDGAGEVGTAQARIAEHTAKQLETTAREVKRQAEQARAEEVERAAREAQRLATELRIGTLNKREALARLAAARTALEDARRREAAREAARKALASATLPEGLRQGLGMDARGRPTGQADAGKTRDALKEMEKRLPSSPPTLASMAAGMKPGGQTGADKQGQDGGKPGDAAAQGTARALSAAARAAAGGDRDLARALSGAGQALAKGDADKAAEALGAAAEALGNDAASGVDQGDVAEAIRGLEAAREQVAYGGSHGAECGTCPPGGG